LHLRRGDGNGWVRMGMVKMLADGSLGGHTAALREPHGDLPSTRGLYLYPEGELAEAVEQYHRDGAVALLLDALEAALRKHPRSNHRHRAIHVTHCPPDLMQRLKAVGAIADIQPKFMHSDGYFYRWPDRI